MSIWTWFLKSLVYELDFLSISNWIFAGYTGSKNKFEIDKKSISWTRDFKNQVQMDKGREGLTIEYLWNLWDRSWLYLVSLNIVLMICRICSNLMFIFLCRMELPQNWERTKGTHRLVKLLPWPVELGWTWGGPFASPPPIFEPSSLNDPTICFTFRRAYYYSSINFNNWFSMFKNKKRRLQ